MPIHVECEKDILFRENARFERYLHYSNAFPNDRNHGNSKKHPKIVHNHFHEKTINVLKTENDCSQKRNVFDDCFKSITNVITNSHKKDDYYKFVEVEGAPFVSQL